MKSNFFHKNYFQWALLGGFFLVLTFLLVGIQKPEENISENFPIESVKYVKIGGKILNIDLALTEEELSLGLSGREKLKENEGMLFVFDYPARYSFWMKDMKFPIDIIWIGEDMRIVYIEKNAKPESFPQTFVSDTDAKYVLEVVSSFSEKNNLKKGDNVEFMKSIYE